MIRIYKRLIEAIGRFVRFVFRKRKIVPITIMVAPTGSNCIVDINHKGTTIFTTAEGKMRLLRKGSKITCDIDTNGNATNIRITPERGKR